MEDNTQIVKTTDNEAFAIAEQALADSPVFVQHIINTLIDCVGSFRDGADVAAMDALGRAMGDLEQFVELYWRIAHEARVGSAEASEAFQGRIRDCISQLECAMNQQDFAALSEGIEGRLIPLLPDWMPVAIELAQGLDDRKEALHA